MCLHVSGVYCSIHIASMAACLQVFSRCNSTECIPSAAVPMVDYWKADNNVSTYVPAVRHASSLGKGLLLTWPREIILVSLFTEAPQPQ